MSLVLPRSRATFMPGWVRNDLWRRARAVPSLDLRFADNKSLVDAISGQNLITFTRSSAGTYVDSQGVIRNAVTNLLPSSEEFSNATWAKDFTAATADAGVAPNGTTTADKVTEDSSNNFHAISQYVTNFASGAVTTLSIYAKAAGRTRFRIQTDSTGGSGNADFDLSAGTATAGAGVFSNGAIVNVGDGWYRCSVRCTTSGAGAIGLKVVLAQTTYGAAYTGDGTSGVLLWGAQLEQSSTVGEYIPTGAMINSAPRFDHNPTTGESLGLLVEEQRSNLCLQSEAFGTSPWAASNVTVTANTTTSPAATLTADTLAATSANGTVRQPVTTTAVAMTFSVYLKRKSGTGNIDITADGTTWVTQTINSSTWTRCIVTQTAVDGTSNPGIRIATSGDEVYAWGGQYE